jgi:hypothetical protein
LELYAPTRIFARHFHDQRFGLSLSAPCRNTAGRAVVLPSNQLPMPSQSSLRGDDCCNFRESAAAEALRFCSEPAALVVGEAKSSAAELLAEHPVLLPQVVDCVLLALVHPASNGHEHKPERIETRHTAEPTMAGSRGSQQCALFSARSTTWTLRAQAAHHLSDLSRVPSGLRAERLYERT